MPNSLIHETSPYLLQHAHNPVNWRAWSMDAFEEAQAENKLVIVSIGYSACHWCHVMERESFEDEQVARLMNENYVCIKVDREERPDVDQLFMDAAQLMTGRGGWPLNAFALPDGRPVYAGTYFPKIAWMGLLKEISYGYKKQPDKYLEYAAKLMNGIRGLSVISLPESPLEFSKDDLELSYTYFISQIDRTNGGRGRAPKFPMPDNWQYLLRYQYHTHDAEARDLLCLTLNKIANGGIYDQLGGGFARYSVDAEWKVPHFEKMLYDNAQLISLYADAWLATRNERYKTVVYDTITFMNRELLSPRGAYYCALDADSEGVEGKFYVWTSPEIDALIPAANQALIKDYFGIDKEALWEHGQNVLLIADDIENLSARYGISIQECRGIIEDARKALFEGRAKRIRPALDDKILLSWNALALKALLDAYRAFHEPGFLNSAENLLSFIRDHMVHEGSLLHSYKNSTATIPAFLEDYSLYIQALITYYQVSLNEASIYEAKKWIDYVMAHFRDTQSPFFWFTSDDSTELAARKIETSDNVISSPNSVMAHNLFIAGKLFYDTTYSERAKNMLSAMMEQVREQTAYYSNWALLLIDHLLPYSEVVFAGQEAITHLREFEGHFNPAKTIAGSINGTGNLPILQGKDVPGKSLIYVCENYTCQSPVDSVSDALSLIPR